MVWSTFFFLHENIRATSAKRSSGDAGCDWVLDTRGGTSLARERWRNGYKSHAAGGRRIILSWRVNSTLCREKSILRSCKRSALARM